MICLRILGPCHINNTLCVTYTTAEHILYVSKYTLYMRFYRSWVQFVLLLCMNNDAPFIKIKMHNCTDLRESWVECSFMILTQYVLHAQSGHKTCKKVLTSLLMMIAGQAREAVCSFLTEKM